MQSYAITRAERGRVSIRHWAGAVCLLIQERADDSGEYEDVENVGDTERLDRHRCNGVMSRSDVWDRE